MFTDQSPDAVRLEWGERGLEAVGRDCAVVVIVDVCSFSTAVDVATGRGATVLPCLKQDATPAFAEANGAVLASDMRTAGRLSLSPSSLVGIEPGTRLVLPSRNGATLSLQAAGMGLTIAACLRNASAVARFVRSQGGPVAVIAGGERWSDDTLRPAWEDLIGAGAVIAGLPGPWSPEAAAACEAFRGVQAELSQRLRDCSSGRELIERGFPGDVELASAFDVSQHVPVLVEGVFVAQPA
jgi:2-phosphosulfolactate phosphatase